MTYELEFLPSARKEWDKLGATLKEHFKKKMVERLAHPRIPGDALHGMPDHYKIKLHQAGYRLVYRVDDAVVIVVVVAIGKRERSTAYRAARRR